VAGCDRPGAQTAESEPVAAALAPIDIQAARADQIDVPTVVRATGTFMADETSDVTPQVSGTIMATPVNVGDFVQSGQIVMRLDDRDARIRLNQVQASLQQAEAEALRAQTEMQRNAELAESGDVSRSAYDRLTAQVAIADAAVAQAKALLAGAEKAVNDTTVHAPFSGHVSARPVAVGEWVTATAKAITIVRIQPITLNLQVPEADAAQFAIGMVVHAEVPAHAGQTFLGAVAARNVAIEPTSRAMTVEATFPNADSALSPGMFGSAQVRLPATEQAVFVPLDAVVAIANGESSAVYAIVEGTAQLRVVQTGEELGDAVRILAGLDAGTMVATTQLDQLFDGAPVRTTVAAAPPQAADAAGDAGAVPGASERTGSTASKRPMISAAGPASVIQDVRAVQRGSAVVLTMYGTGPLSATTVVQPTEGPTRLEMDLPNTTSGLPSVVPLILGPVTSVRIGLSPEEPLSSRVVLGLNRRVTFRIEYAAEGRELAVVFDAPKSSNTAGAVP